MLNHRFAINKDFRGDRLAFVFNQGSSMIKLAHLGRKQLRQDHSDRAVTARPLRLPHAKQVQVSLPPPVALPAGSYFSLSSSSSSFQPLRRDHPSWTRPGPGAHCRPGPGAPGEHTAGDRPARPAATPTPHGLGLGPLDHHVGPGAYPLGAAPYTRL